MQINLNQLKTFYLSVREKSITRAADLLFVTQPAVTMQIKSLEKTLGARLFRKYGKDFQLTELGQVLFEYAEKIFDIVDEMEYAVKGYHDLAQGSLTVGTTRSFARHLMPGLLSLFQEKYPDVKISLKAGSSQEIADGLLAFKYDLGIIGDIPFDKKLKVIPYTREEFCLVTSPRHRFAKKERVSIRELENEPIIIREKGSGSRYAILSLLNSHNINPSVIVEAGSVEFIKEYVNKGRGVSFLYKPEVEREVRLGLLQSLDIEEGPIFIRTNIIFPRNMDLSHPAHVFLQLARDAKEAAVYG